VSTNNGVVVLNLRNLLQQLSERVGVGSKVVNALPASAAEITILKSDQLKAAQNGAKLLKGLPILLVGLSLACFAGALFVAPDRRRYTVRGYGAGLVLAGAAVLAVESLAGQQLVSSLAKTAAMEPVVQDTWTIVTPLLHQAAVATIGYGVVIVVGAWLAGPTGIAVAIRRGLAPYLSEPLLAWTLFVAVMAAVIFWWAPTPATRNPILAVLLVLLAAIGFEGLRRKTRREWPGASLEEAMHEHGQRLRRLAHRNQGAPVAVQQHTATTAVGDGAEPDTEPLENGAPTTTHKEGAA
jgi:hypothetical protein